MSYRKRKRLSFRERKPMWNVKHHYYNSPYLWSSHYAQFMNNRFILQHCNECRHFDLSAIGCTGSWYWIWSVIGFLSFLMFFFINQTKLWETVVEILRNPSAISGLKLFKTNMSQLVLENALAILCGLIWPRIHFLNLCKKYYCYSLDYNFARAMTIDALTAELSRHVQTRYLIYT